MNRRYLGNNIRWIGSSINTCGAHGGYETAEVRDVRRNGGGRGLCGGPGKRADVVFPGRLQSFRHQRRPPVDDCSPGRGEMAQNGGTRQGAEHFTAKWIVAEITKAGLRHAVVMLERDGKDQGEDVPKQAGSCWFARPC